MWGLASKPEQNPNDAIFKTLGLNNNLISGMVEEPQFSWYNIDPKIYGSGGKAPNGISPQSVSQPYVA